MAVVVITGTSSGIGKLATETLARAGHTVYATMRESHGRNSEAAESLGSFAEREGVSVRVVEMDVQDTASVNMAFDQILSEEPHIDAVVNNAGLMSIGLAEGFTEAQAEHQIDLNLMG